MTEGATRRARDDRVRSAQRVPPESSTGWRRRAAQLALLTSVVLLCTGGGDAASLCWATGLNLACFAIPTLAVLSFAFLRELSRTTSSVLIFIGAVGLVLFFTLTMPLAAVASVNTTFPLSSVISLEGLTVSQSAGVLLTSFVPFSLVYLVNDSWDLTRLCLTGITDERQWGLELAIPIYVHSNLAALLLLWATTELARNPDAVSFKAVLLGEVVSHLALDGWLYRRFAAQQRR